MTLWESRWKGELGIESYIQERLNIHDAELGFKFPPAPAMGLLGKTDLEM